VTLADLRALLSNANVAAFLRVIRQGESRQTDDAYTLLNGGGYFIGLLNHPYAGQKTPPAKAAGAYQFIASTWGEVSRQYGIPGFGPREQDMGAVARIIYRQALDDVLAGRFESAVIKCRQEWTSLPGAAENTHYTMDKARAVYLQYGGSLTTVYEAADVQNPSPFMKTELRPTVNTRNHMDPISIFLPIVAQLIPQIAKIVGGGERAQQNVAVAQTVLDTVVKATGSANEQEAVAKMQSDPAMLKAATEAVVTEPSVLAILEIGGGLKAAREADVAATQADKPFWFSPAFWISVILLLMPFMLLADVFYVHPEAYDGNLRTQIVTGVLAIVMIVGGYFLGSSQGSQKKDDLLARK